MGNTPKGCEVPPNLDNIFVIPYFFMNNGEDKEFAAIKGSEEKHNDVSEFFRLSLSPTGPRSVCSDTIRLLSLLLNPVFNTDIKPELMRKLRYKSGDVSIKQLELNVIELQKSFVEAQKAEEDVKQSLRGIQQSETAPKVNEIMKKLRNATEHLNKIESELKKAKDLLQGHPLKQDIATQRREVHQSKGEGLSHGELTKAIDKLKTLKEADPYRGLLQDGFEISKNDAFVSTSENQQRFFDIEFVQEDKKYFIFLSILISPYHLKLLFALLNSIPKKGRINENVVGSGPLNDNLDFIRKHLWVNNAVFDKGTVEFNKSHTNVENISFYKQMQSDTKEPNWNNEGNAEKWTTFFRRQISSNKKLIGGALGIAGTGLMLLKLKKANKDLSDKLRDVDDAITQNNFEKAARILKQHQEPEDDDDDDDEEEEGADVF